MKKLFKAFVLIMMGLVLIACTSTKDTQILTTSYIGYDFTKAIVGTSVDVELLTPIGQDFHNFEPTSKDLLKLKKSEVFIYTGFDYDTWLKNEDTLNTYKGKDTHTIKLESFNHTHEESHDHDEEHEDESHEHHDHEGHIHGEHFWTNPLIATVVIEHLMEELTQIYPQYANIFYVNANKYMNEILSESTNFLEYLTNIEEKEIYYVGHMALQGFEDYFKIHIHALEESVNPGTDVTSQQVENFVNELKSNNITSIFIEEVKSHKSVQAINNLMNNKLTIYELHGYHSLSKDDYKNNVTYLDLLKRNIKNLKEAL